MSECPSEFFNTSLYQFLIPRIKVCFKIALCPNPESNITSNPRISLNSSKIDFDFLIVTVPKDCPYENL